MGESDPLDELDFKSMEMSIQITNEENMIRVVHKYIKDDTNYSGDYKLERRDNA